MPAYSQTDLAWAAGIFDGEGCVHTARPTQRSKSRLLKITVANTHLGALIKFYEWFGGSLYEHTANAGPNGRPVYNWCTSARKGEAFLRAVLPYLVIKREQAELAIALREVMLGKDENRFSEVNRLALKISHANGANWRKPASYQEG